MNQAMIEHVLMPVAERITSAPFYGNYCALMKSQFLSADELDQIQIRKMQEVLRHAFQAVPFYREFSRKSGFKAEDFRKTEDLRQLPVVTKDMIRESKLERWIADDVPRRRWIHNSTSGTTGKPFRFVMSKELVAIRYGRYLRANAWAGLRPGSYCLRIWGPKKWYFRYGIRVFLNMKTLSAFEMTDAAMERYVNYVRRHKLPGIEAYTSAAVTLARFILRRGYDDIHVPFVATAGETVFPESRKQIEQAFHCKVMSRYGCREFGLIAQECPDQKGLHVNQESFVLDFDSTGRTWADGRPQSRVLITNLDNHTMPFIRYQLGDLVAPLKSRCTCGRQMALMDHPEGRIVDCLLTPEGKAVSVHFFTLLFGNYTETVREFQIRQRNRSDITVQVVPCQDWSDNLSNQLEKDIRRHLGGTVRLRIEPVQEIPLDPSGKRKILVNEMTSSQSMSAQVGA